MSFKSKARKLVSHLTTIQKPRIELEYGANSPPISSPLPFNHCNNLISKEWFQTVLLGAKVKDSDIYRLIHAPGRLIHDRQLFKSVLLMRLKYGKTCPTCGLPDSITHWFYACKSTISFLANVQPIFESALGSRIPPITMIDILLSFPNLIQKDDDTEYIITVLHSILLNILFVSRDFLKFGDAVLLEMFKSKLTARVTHDLMSGTAESPQSAVIESPSDIVFQDRRRTSTASVWSEGIVRIKKLGSEKIEATFLI